MLRLGFAKKDITPPVGTELGGYAGYRPCEDVHDPLWCKAVVLQQDGVLYALIVLDLLCVDEGLYARISARVAHLGISRGNLIVAAIHSHATPLGLVPGEGPLAQVNRLSIDPEKPDFAEYTHKVIEAAASVCEKAVQALEPFQIRTAKGESPAVGSERHTAGKPGGELTVLHFRTESGKNLIIYDFPCHPTVLSAGNRQVSADFAAGIEGLLGADMAVFVNGAAGDISTRFTRREASFAECDRMARIAAEQILSVLDGAEFRECEPIKGIRDTVTLLPRQVGTPEEAEKKLRQVTAHWKQAEAAGADAGTLRILKSYVEGAGVNLQFAHALQGVREFSLPVTVFRFAGLDFAGVPGELFSTLQPEGVTVIGYANGYYRYIAGADAYDAGYYEALASILERGQGERLAQHINELRKRLS